MFLRVPGELAKLGWRSGLVLVHNGLPLLLSLAHQLLSHLHQRLVDVILRADGKYINYIYVPVYRN